MSTYNITSPVVFDGVSNVNFSSLAITDFVTSAAGDIIYRPVLNNTLARLPIGVDGTILTATGGLPAWQPSASASKKSLHAIGNGVANIAVPAVNTWTSLVSNPLGSQNIIWDTSSFGANDADSMFNTSTGIFTVPTTGIYQLSAAVVFQANNGGVPMTITTAPTGLCVRQVRIFNITQAYDYGVGTRQAEPSGDNQTVVNLPAANVRLTAGDQLAVQVRHDAGISLNILSKGTSGNTTFFSASQI
jgi:hypothetical protein